MGFDTRNGVRHLRSVPPSKPARRLDLAPIIESARAAEEARLAPAPDDVRVAELAHTVAKLELQLADLSGYVEKRSLAGSVLGRIALSASDVRDELPALRQALRDGEES